MAQPTIIETGPLPYTVIGLVDDAGELMVAGVIEGDQCLVDSGYESQGLSRYATCVIAADPTQAEVLAQEQCREANRR